MWAEFEDCVGGRGNKIYGMKSAIINSTQLSVVLQVSMFWPYLAIPVGSFFVVIEVIFKLYEIITGKEA